MWQDNLADIIISTSLLFVGKFIIDDSICDTLCKIFLT